MATRQEIMREIDKTKPLYLKIDFGIRGQT